MSNEHRPRQDWLVIANSISLSPGKLTTLAQGRKIMVLDGAYHCIKQMPFPIDVLLGDFDSCDPKLLAEVQHSTTVVKHLLDQNTTDLEKGLHYLSTQQNVASVVICNAIGLRLDHTLFNVRILKKYHALLPKLLMVTEQETIRYAEHCSLCIKGDAGDGIALLGFPTARVSTVGLQYDVKHYDLQFAFQESISNALVGNEATIDIDGAALVIQRRIDCQRIKPKSRLHP